MEKNRELRRYTQRHAKKELKHKVKRKEKEKVMRRCSGCGESLLQLKGWMMHRSFSISKSHKDASLV